MARPGPGPGAHGPARRVGAMRLSEALDGMRLAYNPITKQLHFVSPPAAPQAPAPAPQAPAPPPGAAGLAKKDSFSDSGAGSVSAGEWSGGSPRAGHRRGGGSFSSTASSLSDGSLSAGYASREEEEGGEPAGAADSAADCSAKLKKKGLSGFFSRGVFPWKSSGSVSATQKNQDVSPPSALGVSWRLFSSKSSNNIANGTNGLPSESQVGATPTSSGANTPHHHKRQGSSASEKQFEDLVASSIALIQHDRPSNLPAKCEEEALRHRQEHARMVEAARRRGEREAAARRARAHEALRHEERLARHAREWTDTILNNWEHMKSSKRTYELWWCGLPPSVRGKVWQLAVGNKLNITLNLRRECVARAERKLHEAQLRRERLKQQVNPRTQLGCADLDSSCAGDTSITHDSINTLQQHGITNKTHENALSSKNCHLHISHENESCIEVNKEENTLKRIIDDKSRRLSASQNGMHRNFSEQNLKSHRMDRPMCPSRQNSRSNPNLVECGDECSMELIQLDIARTFPHLCIFQPNGPYFDVLHELLAAYACYRPDVGYVQGMSFIGAMLILNMEAPQAFVCFANLLEEPVLKAAFTRDGATMQRLWNAYSALLQHNVPALAGRVAPELYLLEWVYTAFAKAMPLDTACRVWDLCMRDGGVFLFRTALGVLHLYQDTLKEMDFISAAQFLTKLPEELCSDALFRSISSVSMTLDGLTFQQLADCCEPPEDPGEDVVRL